MTNSNLTTGEQALAAAMGEAFAKMAAEKGWTAEQAIAWLSSDENYQRILDLTISIAKR